MRFLIALSALVVTVVGQTPMDGTRGTVIVSTQNGTTGESVPVGCLTAAGGVAGGFPACALFTLTPPQSGSVWDGATIDAGAGACGWDMQVSSGPLVCGPGAQALGFYDFNGKMATLEMQTQWNIDSLPTGTAEQTLYWQGTHAYRAALTWMAA